MQKLGDVNKEASTQLFKQYKLLTVHNLYRLRCTMELFKMMKFNKPTLLYFSFNIYLDVIKLVSLHQVHHITSLTRQLGYGTNLNEFLTC